MAQEARQPCRYLERKIPMEPAARDGEPGWHRGGPGLHLRHPPALPDLSFRYGKGQPSYRSAQRKCLHLYCYFTDRELGLIHLELQMWFPMTVQVRVNGQEWLARKLKANAIGFTKLDNAFLDVEDLERAQVLADRLPSLKGRGSWIAGRDGSAR